MEPKKRISTQVITSGAWIYMRMVITNVFNLGVMVILSRVLKPSDFGIVALANVVTRLLVILGEDGIGQYIIYDNKEGRKERVYAAFWLDLFLSVGVAILALLCIPIVELIYAEKELVFILILLFIKYPIDSLSQVPDGLLKKELKFKQLTARDTILEIISGSISVLMAIYGYGVYSLVIPGLSIAPIRFILGLIQSKWYPVAKFYFKRWKEVFTFSANVVGSSLTSFILNEGDTFLVGKLLGSAKLGIYNFAWQTANLVNRNVSGVAANVALPALSLAKGDLDKMKEGWRRMSSMVATIAFPVLIGMAVVAEEFILVMYGRQWKEAILPLRIFIIYALRYSVSTPASSVYKAVGRPDYALKLGILVLPFYLFSIWIGSFYGLVGVSIGVTFIRTLFGFVGFYLVGKCLKMKLWQVIEPLVKPFYASLLMGLLLFCFRFLLVYNMPFGRFKWLIILLCEIIAGLIIYLIILRVVFVELLESFSKELRPFLGEYATWFGKILCLKNKF